MLVLNRSSLYCAWNLTIAWRIYSAELTFAVIIIDSYSGIGWVKNHSRVSRCQPHTEGLIVLRSVVINDCHRQTQLLSLVGHVEVWADAAWNIVTPFCRFNTI